MERKIGPRISGERRLTGMELFRRYRADIQIARVLASILEILQVKSPACGDEGVYYARPLSNERCWARYEIERVCSSLSRASFDRFFF